MLAGERPFEDWMYSHGYTIEDINKIYSNIDEYLARGGIIPGPLPDTKIH